MIRYDARRSAAAWAGAPVLLLDETLIQEQHGIRREVQVGSKSPLLVAPDRDKPWEYCGAGMSKRIHLYGTVLYDDLMGKYRMWYMGRMGPHWRFPEGNYQIPGLHIPRTDERPYHCNGVTHDRHGRALQTNDRGDLTLYADSDDGLAWVRAGTMRWPGAATARCAPSTTTCPRSATTTSISAWWERCTYARRRSPTRRTRCPATGRSTRNWCTAATG